MKDKTLHLQFKTLIDTMYTWGDFHFKEQEPFLSAYIEKMREGIELTGEHTHSYVLRRIVNNATDFHYSHVTNQVALCIKFLKNVGLEEQVNLIVIKCLENMDSEEQELQLLFIKKHYPNLSFANRGKIASIKFNF